MKMVKLQRDYTVLWEDIPFDIRSSTVTIIIAQLRHSVRERVSVILTDYLRSSFGDT